MPYEKIVTDITEFKSLGKKYYLSLTLDIYSRMIIDYEFDRHKGTKLAIPNMIRTFQLIGDCSNTIFHSDNGVEYTSNEARELEKKHGYNASFSRLGKVKIIQLLNIHFQS